MTVLEVADLTVGHTSGVRAVHGLSFTVESGETLGIVGESGAGKTTLALALMGLLPDGSHVTGSVRLCGRELLGRTDAELSRVRGKDLAIVFQDPLSALTPVRTVGGQIAEAVRIHSGTSRAEARARAAELLDLVGIPDAARRARGFPHEFSGGMRQRVMIAMALAGDPVAIVADEPTASLDVTVRAQVLDVLRNAQRATGAAIVVISHDLAVVAEFADRFMVMREGRAVEGGPAQRLKAPPRVVKAPSPRSDRAVVLEVDGLVRHHAVHTPRLRRRTGTVPAVDGIGFDVREGETLALVGESGSGKTTALMEILRLSRPPEGRVTILGRDTSSLGAAHRKGLRREVQVVFQDPCASLNPRMRVAAILAEPLTAHGVPVGDRVGRLLELVGLEPGHAQRYPHELSGGQSQRVAMARALALEPRLLLLDEPVSSLDKAAQARVMDLLRDLRARLGLALLLVAHDLDLVHGIADRVAVMSRGRIVEIGSVGDVYGAPRHPCTRALLAALPGARPHPDLDRVLLRGDPSDPTVPPAGCRFRARCPKYVTLTAVDRRLCEENDPGLRPVKPEKNNDHSVACHAVAAGSGG
ncbi:dipeptide ABC transporter ATP-binding protein [Actinomadura madurae]|uniref:dipeptide ABC transporter ATP-binding protein n=1 Tax=Actinomadura madurae TaxID=1993 RepID=UPI00399C21B6